MPKFGTEFALFGCFWGRISKSCCLISNQHPGIFLIAKFREKPTMSKFGRENALIGPFEQ